LKDVPIAADGDQFGVNAVMATFPIESDKAANQIEAGKHPQPTAKPTKAPAKKPAAATKPK
jgi:hypothetical protein